MAQRTLFLLLVGFVGTVCIIMVSFNKMATAEENGGTIYVCVRQCLSLNFLLFLLRILLVVRLIVLMQPHP